jgi:DNA repair photolyase
MQTIERKSLLYQSGVEYADFCLNHVEGCSHGCKYPCYAYMMKKRCGIVKNYKEWCQPKIVSNALELLDKEIPKYKEKIKYVHMCFSTDPFMYKQKQVGELSLKIIDKLNKSGIRCTVLTKGVYPKELVDRNGVSIYNEYGITLVSLDENFKKEYEPNSANFKDRINSLKYLHDKGIKTWVSMEPYPTPNIIKQDLIKILDAISFVDKIIFGRLNYNVKSSEFRYTKEFYNSQSRSVIKFCKENKISYHIKEGTQI